MGARRSRRGQQAVVGVLAAARCRRRARLIARANGSRPHRSHLHDAAPARAVDCRLGRAGRRTRDVGSCPRLGHRQLAGRRARPRPCGPRESSGCRCPQRLNCRTASFAPTGSRTRRWRPYSPTPTMGLVASYVLAGGTLTGKYLDGGLGSSRLRQHSGHRRRQATRRSVGRVGSRVGRRPRRAWRSRSLSAIRDWPACCSARPRPSRSTRT